MDRELSHPGQEPVERTPASVSGRKGGAKVRTRLLVALGLVAVLVAAPSVYVLLRLTAIEDIARDLRIQYAATSVVLGELDASLADLDRALRGYVATGDPALGHEAEEAYRNGVRAAHRLEVAGFDERTRPVQAALDTLGTGLAAIDAAVEEGRLRDATATLERLKPVLARDATALAAIRGAIDREAARTVRRAESTTRATATTLLLALLATLALAVVVAVWVTRQVSSPLRRLEAATGAVGKGRFRLPDSLPYRRHDEIGALARAFRHMTERLAELERLRAEFMAAVTHDLKNPINVIGGYAQMLEDGIYGDMTERQGDTARRIREQARMLEGQVNHLTDLSRMEAGGFRVDPGSVETADLLARAERAFRALADQRNIRFDVEGSAAPERIRADADRLLHEVLGNLLGNAFKFTDPGGEVTLLATGASLNGSRPRQDAVRLVVRDSGHGIPEDALPHIFEKYYQVGHHSPRKGGGLGLAIARQVVEGHGGKIRVESREGQGTTFTVDLPIHGPDASPKDRHSDPAPD